MSPLRPLLVTGPARSGTTLVARMLSAHAQIEIAVDPLFAFVKLARDILSRGCTPPLDPRTPLLDGYGAPERLVWLDAMLFGDLDAPVGSADWDAIRPGLAARCEIESPDLVGLADALGGPTLAAALERFLAGVVRIRDCGDDSYVGLKEVWAVDLVPAVLGRWPEARAILVRRDPRAVLASNLAMARRDPSQVAHPLSVLRHWRKQEAVAAWMATRDDLAGRFHVVDYERLVANPAAALDDVCAFLDVPADDGMLDPQRVTDATGRPFVANTSFEAPAAGVAPELAERWRASLDPHRIALTEFVCGAEMTAAGLATDTPHQGAYAASGLLSTLLDDDARAWSWRSDLGDPARDLGLETARRELMDAPTGSLNPHVERRLFLFPEAREALSPAATEPVTGAIRV